MIVSHFPAGVELLAYLNTTFYVKVQQNILGFLYTLSALYLTNGQFELILETVLGKFRPLYIFLHFEKTPQYRNPQYSPTML